MWGAVIVAAIGAVASLAARLMDRRKVDTETDSVAVSAMVDTVSAVRAEMTAMHGEIRQLRDEVGSLRRALGVLRAEYHRLRGMVVALGGDPGPEIEDANG